MKKKCAATGGKKNNFKTEKRWEALVGGSAKGNA
jgi:hypothetical protein